MLYKSDRGINQKGEFIFRGENYKIGNNFKQFREKPEFGTYDFIYCRLIILKKKLYFCHYYKVGKTCKLILIANVLKHRN